MPTVLRVGPYRFFFYSNEGIEPPHVHVEHGEKYAKYWLDPIRLAWNRGYNRSELAVIRATIMAHQTQLLARWNGYFGS